jgi:hypothetical protein
MTHLKVDVATFLSYRQNNRERIYFDYFHHLFSLISTLLEIHVKKPLRNLRR